MRTFKITAYDGSHGGGGGDLGNSLDERIASPGHFYVVLASKLVCLFQIQSFF